MRTGHFYTREERKTKKNSKKTFTTQKDIKLKNDAIAKKQRPFSTLQYLHNSIGNQNVGKLLREGIIQPSLFTSQSSNSYEIEANRVAKEISTGMEKKKTSQPAVQQKSSNLKKVNYTSYGRKGTAFISMPKKNKKESAKIQKAIKISKKQQKRIDPSVERGIKSLPGGEPMNRPLNDMMSRRMNYNFDRVRVHSNSPLPGKINAYAFTYGNDIVLGKKAPPKGTKKYNELIAHEATHVVQQKGTKNKIVQRKEEEKPKKKKKGFFSFIGDALSSAANFLLEKALKALGIDIESFKKMLKNAGELIGGILKDPGKFFGNLIKAVKGGIGKFMTNILKHLKNGVMMWLFGSVGNIGITMPKKFDLAGIFSIVGQLLNIGYAALIRAPLVKEFGPKGEQVVSAAEKGVGMVKDLVEKGPMGIFEHMKDMLTSLPGMILSGIISFVRNTIITRAIAQIMLMLNPAGAIIGIIKGIYDVVMFFINNWQRIVDFATAVVNSIGEIARGNVGGAIAWIEQSLAKSIPVLIGFLAQMVGASGAGKTVLGIIKKAKKKIDNLVGKVVKKVAKVIKKTPIYKAITSVTKKVDKAKKNVKKKVDNAKKKVEKKVDKVADKGKQSLEAKKKAAAEARKKKEEEKRKKDAEKKKKALEKKKAAEKKKLAAKKKKEAERKRKAAEKAKKKKGKESKRLAKKKAKDQKKQNRKNKKKGKKPKVDDKDRKKHQKYVDQMIKKLSKKYKKKGTFEEFYNFKKEEAASLEASYQSKVKKGTDVVIKMSSYGNAKKACVIEFDVMVKDNTTRKKTKTSFNSIEGISDEVKKGVAKMHNDAKPYVEDQIIKNLKKDSNFGKKKWAEVKEWLLTLTPFINILHKSYKSSRINIPPVKSAIKTVMTQKVKGNKDHEKNLPKYEVELFERTGVRVNKGTADSEYTNLREALLNYAFENKDPTNAAVKTYNDSKNPDVKFILEDKSGLTREIDEYKMNIKFDKSGGQAHHFGQDAAYRDKIPSHLAVSIVLFGNAFKEKGSEHYIAHQQMEIFWDQYREGGKLFGKIPTNALVLDAMYKALITAGIDQKTAETAKSKTAIQQNEYGLTLDMKVPRIPDKINQKK